MRKKSSRKAKALPTRDLSSNNEIKMYLHCTLCLEEKPEDISPRDWQRIQVGFTPLGMQVWCVRHECNIVHIDFEGHCHPANQWRADEERPIEEPKFMDAKKLED